MRPGLRWFLVLLLVASFSVASLRSRLPVPQQNVPVIRTTTRLVQLSVVVTDKKGQPVTGLNKENFTILDGGLPQKIAVFSSELPPPSSQPVRTLPPNIFTNRHDRLGEPPGSKSIIFLDALNTSPTDQAYAREQVLKFLKTIQPQDHFAIYALMDPKQLLVLHEFTRDDSELVKAIREFKVKQPDQNIVPFASPVDSALPPAYLPMVPQDSLAANSREHRLELADEYARLRVYPEVAALIGIANHVAAVPGRKNLIWITGGVRRAMGNQDLPDKVRLTELGYRLGSPQFATTEDELFRAVTQSCNAANVVMYGVDVHGVQSGGTMDPIRGGASVNNNPMTSLRSEQRRMNSEQSLRDTYRFLADGTGGSAFYGNNDIAQGMEKAFDDGRYAYMLGYYPDHGLWDGKFRKLQIKVNADGVHTRHRDGYYATTEAAEKPPDPEQQMRDAAAGPLDSSALSLLVSGLHVQPPGKRELTFQVGVYVQELLLDHAAGHWKGAIDVRSKNGKSRGHCRGNETHRAEFFG